MTDPKKGKHGGPRPGNPNGLRGGTRPDTGPTPSHEGIVELVDLLERRVSLRQARGEMGVEEAAGLAKRLRALADLLERGS